MSTISIRPHRPDDAGSILRFIQELAEYERDPNAVFATEEDLLQTLFCEDPKVHGLICEHEGEAIGFAVYFFNYSTWLGKHGLYLEDLYVTPAARGLGAGKALLKAMARIALEKGCGRYEWSVLRWNTPAIEFYEACGAEPMDEWVGYRMDTATLTAFAESAD
ncbi:MAG: GNAT superfamily N-acetyltransferase [Halieaceae bacterium]|jgi:GNAT superfamily N-acetyltransferase